MKKYYHALIAAGCGASVLGFGTFAIFRFFSLSLEKRELHANFEILYIPICIGFSFFCGIVAVIMAIASSQEKEE